MMTDEELQARLAAAFHAQADPVSRAAFNGTAIFREATRGKTLRSRHAPGARSPRGRLIAAAASAAAVAVLAGGTWAVAHEVSAHTPVTAIRGASPPASASASPGPSPSTQKVPADGPPPPYYVIADGGEPDIEIRSSATGAVLSTVQVPQIDGEFTTANDVAVDGNNSTFVVADSGDDSDVQFYLLHVSGDGRSAQLTPAPVAPVPVATQRLDGMAASPDGSELALAIMQGGDATPDNFVEIVSLATGAVQRTWSDPNADLSSVSWADGGSELGVWDLDDYPGDSGLWLLNTSSPGGSLTSGRLVLPVNPAGGGSMYGAALLTPGGETAVVVRNFSDGTAGVEVVSVSTGAVTEVLGPADIQPGAGALSSGVLTMDPTGTHLLVQEGNAFGRFDGSTFTPLQIPAGDQGHAGPGTAAW